MKNIYQERVIKLSKSLENNSSVLIFSGNRLGEGFRVDRNFYYLTGIDAEGMILQVSKINKTVSSSLYILPYDETLAKWVGGRLKPKEATVISGIKDIRNVEMFDSIFASTYDRLIRGLNGFSIYLDCEHSSINEGTKYAKKIKREYPSIVVKDAFPLLAKLRMIKDKYEVDKIIEANKITSDGVTSMMKNIKGNKYEMEIEGYFLLELMKQGCKEVAFPTIAASGNNATTLHYGENNCKCHDGDLFLCDLGATVEHYCADVSRTFPVNGKFTKRQKEIYQCVLDTQKLIEKTAKPKMTLRELNQVVIDHYAKVLPKLNLKKPVSEYYFHGVSHLLGLDCHDINLNHPDIVLEEGMVISNEPGLYIADEKIGIRIEDDLLITAKGCKNLSCAPKEISDIEKIMKK